MPVTADFAGRCSCCNNPWSRPSEGDLGYFAPACNACVADDAGVPGLDPANMDTSVSPGSNFFRHSNGVWMDSNPIPGEYPSWNTFTALHDKNLSRLKDMLETLPIPEKGSDAKSAAEKVAAFWGSAIDEESIEALGAQPLAPVLAVCDRAESDRTAAVAKLQSEFGINVFFACDEGPDDKDSQWTLLQICQGGLGLPDRDYYFDEDKAEKRSHYKSHVARVFGLLGECESDAAKGAEAVLRLESSLAASHLTRTERRDPETVYNKMNLTKLSALCKGGVEWPRFFELIGKPSPKSLNVDSPPALATACRLIMEASSEDFRWYLRWHAAHSLSAHLPKVFVDAHFDFYLKEISGQKEQKPRWKRAMAMVESALGEAVGELYVTRFFGGDAKAKALSVVESVRQALEQRLNEVDWMSAPTRAKALEKMSAFGVKIGFPDKWIDYSPLSVVAGDHLGNVIRARAFEFQRRMGFADAATDKTRWLMLPQQINAYYHPNLNEIVFPAAILQPPFFNPDADEAVNFGSFGAVVGHEMTHGFDDQGRQFDAHGNLKDWWAQADASEYEKRVAVQIAQASAFTVYGKPLNGKLTCGENIADLGGLKLAWRALTSRLQTELESRDPKRQKRLNGFTPQQRFFLAWAQVWRENTSKEQALKMLTLDPHGPNEYRTNGPLTNMKEFHEAFNVQPGEPMYRAPDDCVDIW